MIAKKLFDPILFIGVLYYFLKISFSPSTSFLIVDVIFAVHFIKCVHQFTLVMLKKFLTKSAPNSTFTKPSTATSIVSHQRIYLCKTYRARLFPVRHAFEHSILYFGIDLDLLKDSGGFL